jgi:hypothetical protein
MFDRDIRPMLLRTLNEDHPGAAVFEEFPICRKGRADMVAVSGAIWGYEIKSDRDTLNRLPIQIPYYECIFDFSVVVATERHLKHIGRLVPAHWGIFSASGSVDDCSIVEMRRPRSNPNRQIDHIIRLLWKTEGIKVLRKYGIKTPAHMSVCTVWELLRKLPRADVEESVRNILKHRYVSGVAAQQMSGGD